MRDMIERRYKADWTNAASRRRYQKDVQRMLEQGYEAVNATTHEKPLPGFFRSLLHIMTLGIFTLLWPPRPVMIVMYRREGLTIGESSGGVDYWRKLW